MKNTHLLAMAAIGTVVLYPLSGSADEQSSELLKQRQTYLEQRIASQDKLLRQMLPATLHVQESWLGKVELGGAIEIEAGYTSEDGGESVSDIALPTAELGLSAEVNDWVEAEIVLLYEDEGDNEGGLGVDAATVRIANPEKQWFFNAGEYGLPFGTYETGMISDPVTLELGEITDTALELGFESDTFSSTAFIFQGNQSDEIDNFGLGITLTPIEDVLSLSLGYINDLGESNSLVDDEQQFMDQIPAVTASATVNIGSVSVIAEYLAALESIQKYANEEPSAYNVEVGVVLDSLSVPLSLALGYQGTDEAENTAGGFPETRVVAALGMELVDGLALGFEMGKEESYDQTETSFFTAQLAIEF